MADTNLQFEALKIARDLLMDEYVEQVNQLEQRWAAEAPVYWRAQQIIIDYPELPTPPTVRDMLETANMLLVFFNGNTSTWYPEPEPFPVPAPEPEPGNTTPMPGNVVVSTEQNVQ